MKQDRPWPPGRIALGIEYDGSRFHGWQAQTDPAIATVQETLEQGLSRIASAPIRVYCAGRTDTGVHASAQVVHFDCPVARPRKAWLFGANTLLPDDVAVSWARPVPDTFHARFSALARRYRYLVCNRRGRPGIGREQMCWFAAPLDADLMQKEARCLLGEQDFEAFRSSACQSATAMRRVDRLLVERRSDLIVIDIEANAFLHHMVRNIAGALLAVGSGRQPAGWTERLLASRDRSLGAETAPAAGLYLVAVDYPEEFGLPAAAAGPWFLPLRREVA